MSIRAFGPRAEAYAARMLSQETLLLFEPEHALEAQQAAVELRCAGPFDAMLLYDDPRFAVGTLFAGHVASSYATYDERRLALDTLARNELVIKGQTQSTFSDYDPKIMTTARDALALAERVLVRSWTEYYRLATRLDHAPGRSERILAPHGLPEIRYEGAGEAIIVWAPTLPARALFIVAMALEEVRRPAFIVCEGRLLPGLRARQITGDEALSKIVEAALVIAADPADPSQGLAFRAAGAPVIAPYTTGIAEFAPGVVQYEPWSRRSVVTAVLKALAQAPRSAQTVAAPIPAAATASTSGARVSVIMRTFNREKLLERALQSLAAQTHRAYEAIVVNNGGRDVEAIVRRFPFASQIHMEAGPIWRAANAGLDAARGTYVALLDDDDAFFPDHLQRMVQALERSSAPAAYADALNVYLAKSGSKYLVHGYAGVLIPDVSPSLLLSRCQFVGASRVVFRRDAVGADGFREELPVAGDYEMWLRLNRIADFVRVNAVTSMYTQFEDASNVSLRNGSKYLEAHRAIFAAAPVGSRPGVEAERESVLQYLAATGGLGMTPPPLPLVTRLALAYCTPTADLPIR